MENLEILADIIQLRFDNERSKLSQKIGVVSALEHSLVMLETRAQRSALDHSDSFVQMQLGTRTNWQTHLSRAQASLRQELQTAQAQVEFQTNQFSRAFGEQQTLASLRSNQEKSRKDRALNEELSQTSLAILTTWNSE